MPEAQRPVSPHKVSFCKSLHTTEITDPFDANILSPFHCPKEHLPSRVLWHLLLSTSARLPNQSHYRARSTGMLPLRIRCVSDSRLCNSGHRTHIFPFTRKTRSTGQCVSIPMTERHLELELSQPIQPSSLMANRLGATLQPLQRSKMRS